MNPFYKQPIVIQWILAILLLLIGFYLALEIIELWHVQPIFGLYFLLYVPIAQFTTAPFFKLTGVYSYYSPMLLGYMANSSQIDLHSGLSFDYLFVMRKYNLGIELRNRLLLFYLDGFLHIIDKIENNSIPKTVKIIGTSYFFNHRTLLKLGFELKRPSLFYRLNLLANFIDLFWMYSVSQGRLTFPKLWQAKKASILGAKLLENKVYIEYLRHKMRARLMNE
jgi:hypothetical protein